MSCFALAIVLDVHSSEHSGIGLSQAAADTGLVLCTRVSKPD
jgi:hypothetical protein